MLQNSKRLEELATLAPKTCPTPPVHRFTGAPQGVRLLDRASPRLMDLDRYLSDHGIRYEKRPHSKDPTRTMFILLDGCLFDENHRGKEARIEQSPAYPFLTYHCFHDSCNHTWKEARKLISGDKSLREYLPYAEDRPSGKTKQEQKISNIVEQGEELLKVSIPFNPRYVLENKNVPPPHEVDPHWFFTKNDKGRMTFVPAKLARYLALLLGPIWHTEGTFWRYEGGVYRFFSRHELHQAAVFALGALVRPTQCDNAIKVLEGLVNRHPKQWHTQEKFINCLSGMLDIETAEIHSHDPKYNSRIQIPRHFDWSKLEKAKPWSDFLDQVQPGPKYGPNVEALQRFAGYILLPDNRFEKALFLKGEGGNGKGVFIDVQAAVVGEEYVSALSIHDLSERFKTYRLETAILNISTEMNPKTPAVAEKLKQVISGDLIGAERKYGGEYEFRPRTKFIFSLNRRPTIPDVGWALERRLIIVPFDQTFDESKKDVRLREKLTDPEVLTGVFMWNLTGLERLMKEEGFKLQGITKEATNGFAKSLNPTMLFVDETLEKGPAYSALAEEVWQRYQTWCKASNHKALSRNNFYEMLESLPGVKRGRHSHTRRSMFFGIRFSPGSLAPDGDD